ncbi:YdeI/OmpD-associated family protein [Algoriphagus sp. SE2]|uniref:YdeI/OmpD-associated family protein n=1 Tax=Algoriphagus sp. SE2 TaxID=3141536 RepID=UPI0031CD69BE
MIETEKFEKVEITSSKELRNWLLQNYKSSKSFWLVTFKKSEADKYVSRWDVLDELICFGWIDGIRRKLDDNKTMQLISPRKVEHWAKTYKERAVKLIKDGKMHVSGFKSIEESKASGLWDFMDDVDNLIVPKDLLNALSKNKEALDFFHAINDSSKRFVLRWLKLAKTEKTRSNRINQLVELSGKGEKLKGS